MSPSFRIARRLPRFALAAALLASGLHYHRDDSLLEQWQGREPGLELRSVASHPSSPLHVESVRLERAPRCLECLLRQKDHALVASVRALPKALEPILTASSPDLAPPLLRRADDPGRPRGPPLL